MGSCGPAIEMEALFQRLIDAEILWYIDSDLTLK